MNLDRKYSKQHRMVRLWHVFYTRGVESGITSHKMVRTRRRAEAVAALLARNDDRLWVTISASGHSRWRWYSSLIKKHGKGRTYEEHHFSSSPLSPVEMRARYKEKHRGRK